MPVTSASKTGATAGASGGGDRLEFSISARTDDGKDHSFLFHTSYKKHVIESYKLIEGYTPAYSTQNTITTLTTAEFTQAFDDWGDRILDLIKAQDVGLAPNSQACELDSGHGVYFHSDSGVLGPNVHCFPCVPASATSVKSIVLTADQLKGLVAVCRFLYFTNGFKAGTPEATFNRPTGKPTPEQLALLKARSAIEQTWRTRRSSAKAVTDQSANSVWLQALLGPTDYGRLTSKIALTEPPIG